MPLHCEPTTYLRVHSASDPESKDLGAPLVRRRPYPAGVPLPTHSPIRTAQPAAFPVSIAAERKIPDSQQS